MPKDTTKTVECMECGRTFGSVSGPRSHAWAKHPEPFHDLQPTDTTRGQSPLRPCTPAETAQEGRQSDRLQTAAERRKLRHALEVEAERERCAILQADARNELHDLKEEAQSYSRSTAMQTMIQDATGLSDEHIFTILTARFGADVTAQVRVLVTASTDSGGSESKAVLPPHAVRSSSSSDPHHLKAEDGMDWVEIEDRLELSINAAAQLPSPLMP